MIQLDIGNCDALVQDDVKRESCLNVEVSSNKFLFGGPRYTLGRRLTLPSPSPQCRGICTPNAAGLRQGIIYFRGLSQTLIPTPS